MKILAVIPLLALLFSLLPNNIYGHDTQTLIFKNRTSELFDISGSFTQSILTRWRGLIPPYSKRKIKHNSDSEHAIEISSIDAVTIHTCCAIEYSIEGHSRYYQFAKISYDQSNELSFSSSSTSPNVKNIIEHMHRQNRLKGFELVYDAHGKIVVIPLAKEGRIASLLRTFLLMNRSEEPLSAALNSQQGHSLCSLRPGSYIRFSLNGYYNESLLLNQGNYSVTVRHSIPDAFMPSPRAYTAREDPFIAPAIQSNENPVNLATFEDSQLFIQNASEQALCTLHALPLELKITTSVLIKDAKGLRKFKPGSIYRTTLDGSNNWLQIHGIRSEGKIRKRIKVSTAFLKINHIGDNQLSIALHEDNYIYETLADESDQINSLLRENRLKALQILDGSIIPETID